MSGVEVIRPPAPGGHRARGHRAWDGVWECSGRRWAEGGKEEGGNGSGRGPDAGRTIQFKETDADRTRAWPFLQGAPRVTKRRPESSPHPYTSRAGCAARVLRCSSVGAAVGCAVGGAAVGDQVGETAALWARTRPCRAAGLRVCGGHLAGGEGMCPPRAALRDTYQRRASALEHNAQATDIVVPLADREVARARCCTRGNHRTLPPLSGSSPFRMSGN
eukprot:gene18610-biopygen5436